MPKINLTDSCVAYYKLDDNASSTVVLDAVGGYHGTSVRNTSLMHTEGKVRGALAFDGASDSISIGSFVSSLLQAGAITINLWFKPKDQENRVLLESETSARDGINIIYDEDILIRLCTPDAEEELSLTTNWYNWEGIEDWYMLTVTVEQSGAKISVKSYINGSYDDQGSGTLNGNLSSMSDVAGYLGSTGSILYFDGAMDNIMIFDKALSAEEVAFLYNGGRGTETLAGELYRTPHSLGSPWDNSLAAPGGNSLASPDGNDL